MSTFELIPMPKNISAAGGNVTVPAKVFSEDFPAEGAAFAAMAEKIHGVTVQCGSGGIGLFSDPSLGEGEYRIECDAEAVRAFAADRDGASYAMATLVQLMTPSHGDILFPQVSIFDRPDCHYRSLMIDLARKWHDFSNLLEYVDLCWLYKMKFLQLHFMDADSYTLPSRAFPKLPTVNGHYSEEQIARLNDYALSRNVEIVPEMEVPGHSRILVLEYPELFANENEENAEKGIYEYVICPGKPGIMDSLRTLTSEIIGMFPNSRYLHIGGDEAPDYVWRGCSCCKKYMEENGIEDASHLYSEFIARMTDLVLDLGRTPIVWEGFPKEGDEQISREVIVMEFESAYRTAPDLLESGFRVINASWQPVYMVPDLCWTPEEIAAWNVYRWEHPSPHSFAYQNPIQVSPTDQVLGAQFCAWECTYEQEIGTVRRNLAAVAERTWNSVGEIDPAVFCRRLERIVPMAEKLM